MRHVKKLFGVFRNLKLRSKLILSFIALIFIPSLAIGFGYYNISSGIISESVRENIYEMVKKNTQIVDIKLSKVQESAMTMVVDPDLYNLFDSYIFDEGGEFLRTNNGVTGILSKYFSMHEDVYSAYIVTSKFTYGSTWKMFIPEGVFLKTSLYSEAVKSKGRTQWIETYDFTSMYSQNDLKQSNFDYRYMFSAVKLLNISTVENRNFFDVNSGSAIIKSLEYKIDRPVLVLNFKESMFRDLYMNSVPIKEAVYYVLDKNGTIISHADEKRLGKTENPIWLFEALEKGTGTCYVDIDGKKNMVCFDSSKVTGWVSAIVVPMDKTLSTLPTVRFYTLYFALGLTVLAIMVAFIISGWIANPIKKLLKGIKSIGEGNFPQNITVTGNDEIGVLVNSFNDMNEKIQKLIEENYEVRIREKEAQIMALNLQFNPHFMSNTLNTINWMAVENGQREISKMIISLSTMLQYTMKNTEELVSFKDDLEWLKSYVFIMENRYEGVFGVEYSFDERLFDTPVLKLFLQPIVENSIIHGFEMIEVGGHIKVSGRVDGSKRYFSVEDNGKGMSSERILSVMQSDGESIGIKNIDKRIKLLFGNEYGLSITSREKKGTTVQVIMPL